MHSVSLTTALINKAWNSNFSQSNQKEVSLGWQVGLAEWMSIWEKLLGKYLRGFSLGKVSQTMNGNCVSQSKNVKRKVDMRRSMPFWVSSSQYPEHLLRNRPWRVIQFFRRITETITVLALALSKPRIDA